MTAEIDFPTTKYDSEPIDAGDVEVDLSGVDFESRKACEKALRETGMLVPEISRNPEIARAVFDVNDKFKLSADFFSDKGKVIILTGIVAKSFELPEEDGARSEFIADATTSLAAGYSPVLKEAEELIRHDEGELEPEYKLKIYEAFTDNELSDALAEKITTDGILDEVRHKLGVLDGDEDPFSLRVMSFSSSEDSEHSVSYDTDKSLYAAQEQAEREFMHQTGQTYVAPAWTTSVGNQKSLCITAPIARRILGIEQGVRPDANIQDIAVLEHEYVHTQGGLNIEGGIAYGISLEEFRAEHFSGNKHGYQDVKSFMQAMAISTGVKVQEIIDSQQKGGTQDVVFAQLANQIGLANMLGVLMTKPKEYDTYTDRFARSASSHIGNPGTVMDRLMRDQEKSLLNERVEKIATILAGAGIDYEYYINNRFPVSVAGGLGGLLKAKVREIKSA